jgi:NAD(P)-dependent dehydrogenase (short-subunit alcohol dehydrogenase family)
MDGLLADRLALITAAGSGIGEAIANGMAQAGARVVAVDIVTLPVDGGYLAH